LKIIEFFVINFGMLFNLQCQKYLYINKPNCFQPPTEFKVIIKKNQFLMKK